MKGKGERQRYTQLNAEFQRRARRDKAFLNEQCKEIEANIKMRKTRDFFKKTEDIKGTFHARMGTIKDRNGKDLTEAEETKKWQGYIEELWTEVCNIVQEAVIKAIPANRQNGCLRRPYKQLRKEKKQRQRRKGKMYPSECRVPENSKEREESLHK